MIVVEIMKSIPMADSKGVLPIFLSKPLPTYNRPLTTPGHNSVQTPESALFLENPPQEAISRFGPLWGGVAENAGQSRLLPLWAISQFGPLWLFPENYS
jgi:hypothetical protein